MASAIGAGRLRVAERRQCLYELLPVVLLDYVGGGAWRGLVRTRVERRVRTERESPGCIVEMMEGHAEVGEYAVGVAYAVVA